MYSTFWVLSRRLIMQLSPILSQEEEEENVDYLKELEAELEQAENDVFEIEDITVLRPHVVLPTPPMQLIAP